MGSVKKNNSELSLVFLPDLNIAMEFANYSQQPSWISIQCAFGVLIQGRLTRFMKWWHWCHHTAQTLLSGVDSVCVSFMSKRLKQQKSRFFSCWMKASCFTFHIGSDSSLEHLHSYCLLIAHVKAEATPFSLSLCDETCHPALWTANS